MNGIDATHSSPAYRDGFLTALDRQDAVTLSRLARHMMNCGNPLPRAVCTRLGIPIGSTYGFAARRIVADGPDDAIGRHESSADIMPELDAGDAPDAPPGPKVPGTKARA